jgi:hypothetical protein
MFLVVAPVAERAGVNRLAHLLRARRLHGAVGLVELHAALLERQAAMREDPAYLLLQIRHCLLVMDVQDLARQHAMPMLRRLMILSVVFGELHHVVREVLALAEKLLIGAETAVEGMAPGIDDLRIRQDQVIKPTCEKLFGSLSVKYGLSVKR